LSSLGFIKDDEILHDALDFAVNELRHQDTILVFKSMCTSAKGKTIAWDFFKEHWTLFRSRYPVNLLFFNAKVLVFTA